MPQQPEDRAAPADTPADAGTAAVWDRLGADGGLWAWGDADGVVPWTRDDGTDLVPLWTSADDAEAECRADAEPGERPVFLAVDELLAEVPDWVAAGVAAAVLQPADGRAAGTVALDELTERLLRTQVDGRG
ncbi:DUF2750 domain-containing protein [Geodermatophilus sp. SYSU D00758]